MRQARFLALIARLDVQAFLFMRHSKTLQDAFAQILASLLSGQLETTRRKKQNWSERLRLVFFMAEARKKNLRSHLT